MIRVCEKLEEEGSSDVDVAGDLRMLGKSPDSPPTYDFS